MQFTPPEFNKNSFHCPHCQVYAHQVWADLLFRNGGSFHIDNNMRFAQCSHCKDWSYWFEGRMVVPSVRAAPPPHIDMPDSCKADYNEARDVVSYSPKAAAALIRLALQNLMIELGEKGKNINEDIASLVSKGLPVTIQRALDICRVVGNNGVHPGEIVLNDTPEIAHNLFSMINLIVEDRIARPKQIEAAYLQLPQGAREAIDKRDNP